MPYVNPGQLFQEYFHPAVQSVLPIVPSLMAAKRAQEAQVIDLMKQAQEAPLRAAQTREHTARANDLEFWNNMYTKLQGGETGVTGGLPVSFDDVIRHKLTGATPRQPTLKPIYTPSETSGQPGKYVYGEVKAGDIAKPEPEALAKIDYWLKGPQGWMQTSEQVPKETYNQRMKEIEAQGGQINEPPEIAIQKAVEQYQALAPLKLQQLDATLKARGIDTTKWNQQQKFWSTIVKDKANREIELIKYTVLNFKDAQKALGDVEQGVFNEMQRIAVGQAPTYLTPQGEGQPAPKPGGPIPLKPQAPQAQPKAPTHSGYPGGGKAGMDYTMKIERGQPTTAQGGMPKRLPGETIDQYLQRVGK